MGLFRCRALAAITAAVLLISCGGGRSASVPRTAAADHLTTPAKLALPVPPPPPATTPAKPSAAKRGPVSNAPHAAFFAGEAALSNGVYYLALPNGNPFGYYSYLADSNYIYHFDIGYLYVFDANDGKGGVYFYDFTSGDWWYTGRQYPFPYIYDFSRAAVLYYYPNASNPGHYTTNPRYFYNFGTGHTVTIPPAVSTLAGDGTAGAADGNGNAAQFDIPSGVAVDCGGNVYVADYRNNSVRKITPGGLVSTLAGGGYYSFADGPGATAKFFHPSGLTVDCGGTVYVADTDNHKIRKITPDGMVSTLAGSWPNGYADGGPTEAKFQFPAALAVDGGGNVYVADMWNNRIRKITPTGSVTTLAGSGVKGFADGAASAAQFDFPASVAVDGGGNVYVADLNNQRIRKITARGVVSTFAGSGVKGSADGTGTVAQFWEPQGVAVDASGNLYVADTNNARIRLITPGGVVSTFAGSGLWGFADGTGTAAKFDHPRGVAVDGSGTVYVADPGTQRIRKIQ